MADEEAVETEDLTEGLEKKKLSGKKLVIFGGAGALVLIIIIVALVFLLGGEEETQKVDELDELSQGVADQNAQAEADAQQTPEELKTLFIELDPQLYNLNTGGQGSSFLRAQITLEVDRESFKADVEVKLPRIMDEFNIYMRELRPEDIDGARGVLHVKEELLSRINQAVAPSRVKDVLFQEFIIQGS
jgi:flagellar FliL protein